MNQANVNLSDGQRTKLMKNKQANVRLSRDSLVGNDVVLIGKRDLGKLNKAKEKGTGVVVYAQAASFATGGSLFGAIAPLARAALPMAAKALGLAGLSFGAEKLLGKIFGSGAIPPEAIHLAQMVEVLTPTQKKMIKNFLRSQGIVQGSGQRGGFLGLLASLGIPLAISLVKKVLGRGAVPMGKGVVLKPRGGKGMVLQPPPPVWGNWPKKSLWTLP